MVLTLTYASSKIYGEIVNLFCDLITNTMRFSVFINVLHALQMLMQIHNLIYEQFFVMLFLFCCNNNNLLKKSKEYLHIKTTRIYLFVHLNNQGSLQIATLRLIFLLGLTLGTNIFWHRLLGPRCQVRLEVTKNVRF